MLPLVSILIPSYNSEKWLTETLQSCQAQTWTNIEIIVVDDGSTDQSYEVAKSFQACNLKVLRQENKGASAARNNAYMQSKGDYIQYLDADDLLSPDKIEAQVKLLQNSDSELLGVSAAVYFYDGQAPDEGLKCDGWPLVDSSNPVAWLTDLLGPLRGAMVPLGAWLTPRSISEKIGSWNETLTLNDDGEYFARAVLASGGIRRATTGKYYYRKFRNGNNLSAQKSTADFTSALMSIDLIGDYLLRRCDDENSRRALARLYMDLAFNSYPLARKISSAAERNAAKMGGATTPAFGTSRGNLLARMFGWKAIRSANHYYHRINSRFT